MSFLISTRVILILILFHVFNQPDEDDDEYKHEGSP